MANPRKFSEKIALQKQKQAEGTAEFERIMKEVYATKRDEPPANQKILDGLVGGQEVSQSSPGAGNGTGGGGSGSGSGASGGGASPDGLGGGGGSPTAYRESRGRSVGVGPMRRPSERKQDRSPYGSSSTQQTLDNGQLNPHLLGPPTAESLWRRSSSDSALHQSALVAGFNSDVNSMGANYQQQQHQQQQQPGQPRSHSPHHGINRTMSPQAQRRKSPLLQPHQLQLQQLQQQQQQMQHQHQLHQQLQMQQLQQHQQQHQQQQQQQNTPYNNAKFTNPVFRPLQDQVNFANTGSLPDLTALQNYGPQQQQQQSQQQPSQQQQQLQQTLSPVMSPHNHRRERDQSPSPFSPAGGGGGAGPGSPYQQQQHSPTGNTQQQQQQHQQPSNSPHLSFTNLATTQAAVTTFNPLPTLGPHNATDYRQPPNPPSPRSSPGLLSSVSATDLHSSAPASPIRQQQQAHQQQQQQQQAQQQQQQFDNSYNSLNTSFHNQFEIFSLGDSNSSPEQQGFANNFVALDFDDLSGGGGGGPSGGGGSNGGGLTNGYNKPEMLDFSELSGSPEASGNNNHMRRGVSNLNNNGLSNGVVGSTHNGSTNLNGAGNNNSSSGGGTAQDPLGITTSPVPSPLGCPSSPLPIPIPMSAQSSPQQQHHHHQQQQQQHHQQQHHQQQQLSLSLHHSPHHSPMHSPHHGNSPLSSSSPVSHNACSNSNVVMNHQQQQQQHHHQQHHHQGSSQSHTPTTANIPSIIFSDYSSNADYTREIFDSLDLDLGQMDVAGLQMLSDQNPIMIADPNIEDSFRRDLN
nr:CREB-regulated transcription coactivator, isoform C [Drosophila melanogaster]NP_649001.1 CREB-regulated transcription coactivator, isoform A [Drosophila melanogaster]AAF49313.1 CREB-regulated transcription coactivator, isoform A [Drosophila melanogaster]AHN58126.1 CREB-regulated transcription coactivator, isoform C [Drosophila melanogaster]|eukprot:NP_001287101.1 CREB-regulated transcription coactivator, isoform C [Drosophila melanogaster]